MRNALIVFGLVCLLGGCARFRTNPQASYQTIKASPTRNTKVARRKHHRALAALDVGDTAVAMQLLNESLLADKDFGPAHNTLGKLYYDQRKFYLAAWEFEYASELMPSRAEPLNNIGLVMESVGRLDDAIAYYQQAFELDSENAQYLGNLLRAKIRSGTDPSMITEELKMLILLDPRPQWSDWAKSLLVKSEINGGMPHEYTIPGIPGNAVAPEEMQLEPRKVPEKKETPNSGQANPVIEKISSLKDLNAPRPLKFPSSRRDER